MGIFIDDEWFPSIVCMMGGERGGRGQNPVGRRRSREIGALWFQCFLVLCRWRGSLQTQKPRGLFPSPSPSSPSYIPELSSHFPSFHTSSILSPVYSRLDIPSSRQTNPRYYRSTSTDLADFDTAFDTDFDMVKLRSKDGWSVIPAIISLHHTSCTLRLSIIGRKGYWSISISHFLERLWGRFPSRTIDRVTADGEVSRLRPCRDFC